MIRVQIFIILVGMIVTWGVFHVVNTPQKYNYLDRRPAALGSGLSVQLLYKLLANDKEIMRILNERQNPQNCYSFRLEE